MSMTLRHALPSGKSFESLFTSLIESLQHSSQVVSAEDDCAEVVVHNSDACESQHLKLHVLVACSGSTSIQVLPSRYRSLLAAKSLVSLHRLALSMVYHDSEEEDKGYSIDYLRHIVSHSGHTELGMSLINKCLLVSRNHRKYDTALRTFEKQQCTIKISSHSYYRIFNHITKFELPKAPSHFLQEGRNVCKKPLPVHDELYLPSDYNEYDHSEETTLQQIGMELAYDRLTAEHAHLFAFVMQNERSMYETIQFYVKTFTHEYVQEQIDYASAVSDWFDDPEEQDRP